MGKGIATLLNWLVENQDFLSVEEAFTPTYQPTRLVITLRSGEWHRVSKPRASSMLDIAVELAKQDQATQVGALLQGVSPERKVIKDGRSKRSSKTRAGTPAKESGSNKA